MVDIISDATTEPLFKFGSVLVIDDLSHFITAFFKFHSEVWAKLFHSCLIIGDLTWADDFINCINVGGNKAIRETLTFLDYTFFNVKLEIDKGPVKFLLKTVLELWGLSVSPVPVVWGLINFHQLWNFFELFHSKHTIVDLSTCAPFVYKSFFDGVTEAIMINARINFL